MTDISIVINGFTWEIIFAKSSIEHLRDSRGVCIYTERKIYIQKDLDDEYMEETLIHELTHAFEYAHGLRDRHSDCLHEDLASFVGLYGKKIIQLSDYILGKDL